MVKPIPDGYHSVTPTLIIKGAAEAIEFYKKAFGAQELYRFPGFDGKSILNAQVKIGDSIVMICDEIPQMNSLSPKTVGGPSSAIYLYVQNSDDVFAKAVSAGAAPRMPMMDGFWGDRIGVIEDPFGHVWTIATRKNDLSAEQIKKAGEEFMRQAKSR